MNIALKRISLILSISLAANCTAEEEELTPYQKSRPSEQWEPKPEIVDTRSGIPSDAIILFDGANLATATSEAYLAVGFGPASTLFDASELGGLTSVPVYRHVAADQYNRFIGIFYVGDFDGAGGITATDQVSLVTVIDGAGDTKEEELGEWDGTRNTI